MKQKGKRRNWKAENASFLAWERSRYVQARRIHISLSREVYLIAKYTGNISRFINTACRRFIQYDKGFREYLRLEGIDLDEVNDNLPQRHRKKHKDTDETKDTEQHEPD